MKVDVIDFNGKKVGDVSLPKDIFEANINIDLMHQAYVRQMANARLGTHETKERGDVSGGGRKPWRQKGTGRARSGTNTSPIWEGGGIAWGPHPREYYRPIPKKFKRAAIRSAFSFMAANDGIRVVELPELSKPKTKTIADFMKRQDIYEKRVLLLFEGKNEHLEESCRNIKGLAVKRSILVNPFDLVWAEHVLITSEALQKIEEVFSR